MCHHHLTFCLFVFVFYELGLIPLSIMNFASRHWLDILGHWWRDSLSIRRQNSISGSENTNKMVLWKNGEYVTLTPISHLSGTSKFWTSQTTHSVMLPLANMYQVVLAGSVDKKPAWKRCLGRKQDASGEQETWGHIFPVTEGLLNYPRAVKPHGCCF